MLLDCCHAGGVDRAKAPGFVVAKAPIPPDVLRVMQGGQGRVTLASSKADEQSWTGSPYSEFTNALLEGLTGAAGANDDGLAYVSTVFGHVSRVVPKRTDGKQHPVAHAEDLTDFPIAYYAAGAKSPNPLPWMKNPPSPPGGTPLTPARRRHLEQQLREAESRRDSLTGDIGALDKSIDNEFDDERLRKLKSRRAVRVADRDAVEREIEDLERQLQD